MRLLFVGDIVGRPGRRALAHWVPILRRDQAIEIVVANGENAAGGSGITAKTAEAIFATGVDAITTGNHAWDKREGLPLIEEGRVLRPANYPPGVPGSGATVVHTRSGEPVGVLNLQGRAFMRAIDDPFRVANREIERLHHDAIAIVVDFHAEATAEKLALGWYLDGAVAAVIGTHTHVQTADERILPNGTAYITDVGMTGPFDSVIGMEIEASVNRFLTGLSTRLEPATKGARMSAVVIDIDMASGRARSIERLSLPVGDAKHDALDHEEEHD